jgi:crotonobetaine/carnitine-CoA ligase
VKCLEGYGMTEIGVITYRRLDEPLRLGSAGRPLEWFDVRIVDAETGEPLAPDKMIEPLADTGGDLPQGLQG